MHQEGACQCPPPGTAMNDLTLQSDDLCVQEARKRAGSIVKAMDDLAAPVQEAWDEQDHITLGYETWQAYCIGEFGRGDVAIKARQIVIAMLRGAGLSERAISIHVGADPATVHRDIADATAAPVQQLQNVVGLDGRSRPASRGGMSGEERREKRRETRSTPPPAQNEYPMVYHSGVNAKWNEPELLDAMRRALETGETDADVARRLGIAGTTASRARIFLEGQRSGQGDGEANGKTRNLNGKTSSQRIRELREAQKINPSQLIEVQLILAQTYTILHGINISDYSLADADPAKVAEIYDDLIMLGEWWNRQLSAVQGYLSTQTLREKIEKMRNTAGRTPEEAESYRRMADLLERKLQNSL